MVPPPKEIKIDGDLSDWNLAGRIKIYVYKETSQLQNALIAMMSDEEALYISGDISDESPMMNRHDPKANSEKVWNADVVQLFLNGDTKQGYPLTFSHFRKPADPEEAAARNSLLTMYLFYHTDSETPQLLLRRGLPSEPDPRFAPGGIVPAENFQSAFKKWENGAGYTFEYKIPWSTLGISPLKNTMTAGAIMTFWSRPDGLATLGNAGHAYDVLRMPGFPFQETSTWGKFVFTDDPNPTPVRPVEKESKEAPKPLSFAYTLPKDAKVTIQIFRKDGTIAKLLLAEADRKAGPNEEPWDGLDELGNPLPPGEYEWRGLYHDGIKTQFLFSVHNSGQPPYKTDDNTGGWGGDHGVPSAVARCGEDAMLLGWRVSESGWGIIRTDMDGKKLWGIKNNAEDIVSDGNRFFVTGDYGHDGQDSVKVFSASDGRALAWGNGNVYLVPPAGGDEITNVATGVAIHENRIYVSWRDRNLIAIYDLDSGDEVAIWKNIESPGRLTVQPDGTVVAITGTVVQRYRDGAPIGKPIVDHIDEPRGIIADPQGTFYVSNNGELQNISVFSPSGEYLRSIGRQGGRPAVGRYSQDGVYTPNAVAFDSRNRLWVAEASDFPKRHSVWDTKTGDFLNEYFGGSSYFGWASMDPKVPDEIYCHNVIWKVDWENNTAVPTTTIWRQIDPDHAPAPNPPGYVGHLRVMTAKNGKQFGLSAVGHGGGNILYMRSGDMFKPVSGVLNLGKWKIPALLEFLEKNKKAQSALWQDQNDDQKIQIEELSIEKGVALFSWVDDDLTIWNDSDRSLPTPSGSIFEPVGFAEDGRPVYDFSKRKAVPFHGSNTGATSLVRTPEDPDAVYTLNPGKSPGFARWKRDGTLVWGFDNIIRWTNSLGLPMGTPGKLYGLTMPLGVAGNFTGAACYASPYYIFTTDGLYVQMIMRNGKSGKLGPDITSVETVTGQLVKPDGMDRYFLLAGDQDGRVTEILGLDSVKHLEGGTLHISQDDFKKVDEAWTKYNSEKAEGQNLYIVKGKPNLENAEPISKYLDGTRSFSVRSAYDEEFLYFKFDVKGSDLVNAFSDPTHIFKGGNLLDIQIATDEKAPADRTTPAPGDVRILVGRQEGKAISVLYRPKVEGFSGKPITLTSPTGKEVFDQIEVINDVELKYKKTPDGFSAIVSIPRSLLNLDIQGAKPLRLDVGYIFGNSTGTTVAARSYWTNNSFAANVTNDVPHESRLEPNFWGEAIVE